MSPLRSLVTCAALLAGVAAQAAVGVVTTPAALGANDTVSWAQLGTDGTVFGPSFTASSAGALPVSGSLGVGTQACLAVVDGSNCSWTATTGFAVGDSLVWAEDSGGFGSGPVSFSFGAAFGAGLYLQAASPGAFTASISAFNGNTLLNSFTVTSGSGNGVFIGVLDTVADITKITVGLSSCAAGCDTQDFAVNSLQLNVASAVPEAPAAALLLAGLAALPWMRRRIASQNQNPHQE